MGNFTGKAIVVEPVIEPVSVKQVKDDLVIETNKHDGRLRALIQEGRQHVEEMTGYRLVTQTVDFFREDFDDYMEIPYPPLQSLTITYYDDDNALQTLNASNYDVNTRRVPATIRKSESGSWPSVYDREDAVIVRAVVGYGSAVAIPEHFKNMVKLYCRWIFDGDDSAKRTLNYMINSRKINWQETIRV